MVEQGPVTRAGITFVSLAPGECRERYASTATYNKSSPMSSGKIACTFAVMAVLSVLAIFFFPALEGPYSVVHGPVTALLSLRAATMVRNAIVRAGQSVRQSFERMPALAPAWSAKAISAMEMPADLSSVSSSVLRC
jgi:hypothetical protein